uniref:Organic anion transporter n=1 Tax=Rhizophora mucronata TaxID=61149 RepID=A0A2P2K149_RHIMU
MPTGNLFSMNVKKSSSLSKNEKQFIGKRMPVDSHIINISILNSMAKFEYGFCDAIHFHILCTCDYENFILVHFS